MRMQKQEGASAIFYLRPGNLYKDFLVAKCTSGIDVSNHFVMLASEVAGGEWQGTWTEDMQAVQNIVPAENESDSATA